MRVEEKGGTIHIKDTAESIPVFLEKVTHEYNSFADQNLIIDLLHNKNVSEQDVELFLDLSKKHKKGNKSFIIVADGINFNEVTEAIQVVPTVLEANDIIEIEEIERDLGF